MKGFNPMASPGFQPLLTAPLGNESDYTFISLAILVNKHYVRNP